MLSRREFLLLLQGLSAAGLATACSSKRSPKFTGDIVPDLLYEAQEEPVCDGCDIRLIHLSDSHAQLLPSYFREPSDGFPYLGREGDVVWQPSGRYGWERHGIEPGSKLAYALSSDNFDELAATYGKTGGYSHIATLIKQLRSQAGESRSLVLDGGDSWQGSATALWTKGVDMVGAGNLLGIDYLTAHWEFTLGAEQFLDNLRQCQGTFLAQNVMLRPEALFGEPLRPADGDGRVFKAWELREIDGHKLAIIGQAYPYTNVAHPGGFTKEWSFGIHERPLSQLVRSIREQHPEAAVVLLSHNGLALDLQLAESVSGIDLILGGHTHEPVFGAIAVSNRTGQTLVTNAGCAGKFINVCDLRFGRRGLRGINTRLLPVFSNFLPEDPEMSAYIAKVRDGFERPLSRVHGELPFTLYRRGNFNGTVDELLLRSLSERYDAPIAFSPGFRWGNSVPAGTEITSEDVHSWTAITYPGTYRRTMTGAAIHNYLEDVADNLLNRNAYLTQGGDMVRSLGLHYRLYSRGIRGSRITDIHTSDGRQLKRDKTYTVAGWADARIPPEKQGESMESVVRGWLVKNYPKLEDLKVFRPAIH